MTQLISVIFATMLNFTVYVYHLYPLIFDGYLDWFHFLVIVKSSAVIMDMQYLCGQLT